MVLHEFTAKWIEDFHRIKEVLNEVLSGLEIKIEHVGSTAVAGLAAKPIIDIDVILEPGVQLDEITGRLQTLGYYHNGNQGIPQREVFKRDNSTPKHDVLDSIVHHLYVCPRESEALKKHLLFRDYLIANEKARREYQALKYALEKEANYDRKKYAKLKETKATDFVNDLVEKARKAQPGNSPLHNG